MPTNTQPAWFNADFYATQKVAQMNATGYMMGEGEWLQTNGNGATEWTPALYNQYLTGYQDADFPTGVTAWQNFEACNAPSYAGNATVTLADINVSPNQYFDVEVYLQNLANYNNANPGAYPGTPPAGGWTVANELTEIFDKYETSVWEHYRANWHQTLNDASTILNPSNAFDTQAYLTARAEAANMTVAELIDQLVKDGKSPIEDYFENGQSITIQAVATPVVPTLPDSTWTVWGEPVTPPAPVDPFDQDVTDITVTKAQLAYPAEGENYEGNTRFDAVWGQTNNNNTLTADQTFTGPEGAYNTLAVTLGKNWKGFNEQKDADGKVVPSVQNVGRVVLEHDPVNIVQSWEFDAKGISEDAYRYDLRGGNGPGAINLKNLQEGVNDIRISDLTPRDTNGNAPDTTYIDYATGANKGKNDALTIQLDNVGATNGKTAKIASKTNFGIEDLTLNTVKGGDSYVDLSGLNNVKTLKFDGTGNITVTDVASTIRTYDASDATGNVNMTVVNPNNNTVVKGGAGNDTVTLSGGSWKPLGLENIENLNLTGAASVNMANVAGGVDVVTIAAAGGQLTNVTSDNFTVHLSKADTTGTVKIDGTRDGSLQNITIDTADLDSLKNLSAAVITTNAVGTVTIEPGENVKQYKIETFSADQANGLIVNAGAINLGNTAGSLKALQVLDLNLEGTESSIVKIALPSIQDITIDGGGKNLTLSDLGGTSHQAAITMSVENVDVFSMGKTTTGRGDTIDFDIDVTGAVTFSGDIINNTTLNSSLQGAINLDVTGASINAGVGSITIDGGPLSLNFEGVGQVGQDSTAANLVNLKSSGNIQYQGAEGADNILVVGIGEDGSQFTTNGGTDYLKFASTAATDTGVTKVNIDLGNDGVVDSVVVEAQTANHLLYIELTGFDATDKMSGVYSAAAIDNSASANIKALIEGCGIGTVSDASQIEAVTGSNGLFTYGGNVYGMNTASDTVLINFGDAEGFGGITL